MLSGARVAGLRIGSARCGARPLAQLLDRGLRTRRLDAIADGLLELGDLVAPRVARVVLGGLPVFAERRFELVLLLVCLARSM